MIYIADHTYLGTDNSIILNGSEGIMMRGHVLD